jgi:hypothetical protein
LVAGVWLRLAPGVYALASAPSDFLRQCWAAVLSEPDASIGVFAAAAILRFVGFNACRPAIVVPIGSNARSRLATVHRFDGALVTRVAGLRVTTPAQTIFDIARRVTFEQLEAALDGQLLDRKLSIEALDERLEFYKGTRRPGLPLMRDLIDERRADGWAPAESELERMPTRSSLDSRDGRPWSARRPSLGSTTALAASIGTCRRIGSSSRSTVAAGTPEFETSIATDGGTIKSRRTD